jgi:hypothetical protein
MITKNSHLYIYSFFLYLITIIPIFNLNDYELKHQLTYSSDPTEYLVANMDFVDPSIFNNSIIRPQDIELKFPLSGNLLTASSLKGLANFVTYPQANAILVVLYYLIFLFSVIKFLQSLDFSDTAIFCTILILSIPIHSFGLTPAKFISFRGAMQREFVLAFLPLIYSYFFKFKEKFTHYLLVFITLALLGYLYLSWLICSYIILLIVTIFLTKKLISKPIIIFTTFFFITLIPYIYHLINIKGLGLNIPLEFIPYIKTQKGEYDFTYSFFKNSNNVVAVYLHIAQLFLPLLFLKKIRVQISSFILMKFLLILAFYYWKSHFIIFSFSLLSLAYAFTILFAYRIYLFRLTKPYFLLLGGTLALCIYYDLNLLLDTFLNIKIPNGASYKRISIFLTLIMSTSLFTIVLNRLKNKKRFSYALFIVVLFMPLGQKWYINGLGFIYKSDSTYKNLYATCDWVKKNTEKGDTLLTAPLQSFDALMFLCERNQTLWRWLPHRMASLPTKNYPEILYLMKGLEDLNYHPNINKYKNLSKKYGTKLLIIDKYFSNFKEHEEIFQKTYENKRFIIFKI